ncbi:MAG: Entericidin EcnA/B family protein [Pseudomonadota bacterium]
MTTQNSTMRSLALITLAALSLGAASCNTVQGLGEDIKSVGETGEEVLDDVT